MAEIIPIRGRDLVPFIERWLEQAKRGEITAMSFAAIMDDGSCCEGWLGDLESCTVKMYGAINVLRDGFCHDCIPMD